MKTIIFLVMLSVGCWFLYGWLKKQSTPEKIQQDPMVRYSTALHEDVARAEAARDKADAAIQREVQSGQTEAPPQEAPAR